MKRITLLAVIGVILWAGWVRARDEEILNHSASVQMQEMQEPQCKPSSNPPGGG